MDKEKYQKQYYLDNKEKISQQRKQYYLENKEKRKEKFKQYYLENKEKRKEKFKQYNLDNKEKRKQYRLDNKEKISQQRKQYYLDNKEKIKQYRLDNKEKIKEKDRQYNLDNKEQKKQYRLDNKEKFKQYYLDNKEKIKQYNLNNRDKINLNYNKRMQIDPLYKLSCTLRSRIRTFIKKSEYNKENTTAEILGCDFETVRKYLENQFIDGMSWDNHGRWHIDHIKPLAKAETEEELYKRCHYTNLQPLWAADNLSKGAKEL